MGLGMEVRSQYANSKQNERNFPANIRKMEGGSKMNVVHVHVDENKIILKSQGSLPTYGTYCFIKGTAPQD